MTDVLLYLHFIMIFCNALEKTYFIIVPSVSCKERSGYMMVMFLTVTLLDKIDVLAIAILRY